MFSIVHEVPTCVCRTRIGPSAPGPTPGHPGAVYVGSCSYVNYAKFIPIPPRTNPFSTRPREPTSTNGKRKTSSSRSRNSNCNSNARVGLLGPLPLPRTLRTIVPHETVRLAYRRGCVVHVGPRAVVSVRCASRRRPACRGHASSRPYRDPLLDKASLHTLLTQYAPISPLKAYDTNPASPYPPGLARIEHRPGGRMIQGQGRSRITRDHDFKS
jgi:hypothetical protein